jgi:hypothetical protein
MLLLFHVVNSVKTSVFPRLDVIGKMLEWLAVVQTRVKINVLVHQVATGINYQEFAKETEELNQDIKVTVAK